MPSEELESNVMHSVGGTHTHVLLELADEGTSKPAIYLGNVTTVSFSVYREKTPVFVCGTHLVDGFAVGKKYVAGSLVTIMTNQDSMLNFMDFLSAEFENNPYKDLRSIKDTHTFMRDDLIPFNIHLIFTTELADEAQRVIIYGATFINNGQAMSINDLITETTVSYVARDIRELHNLDSPTSLICTKPAFNKASNL